MPDITNRDLLRILITRYHADRKAQEVFSDPHITLVAQVTLDSFMRNVASELAPFGLSLEGIE